MGTDFYDIIASLEDVGFYEVALPFILIFTLVFAILQKIKIFGDKGKNFNAVISLVMAFLVVRTGAVVEVMNMYLPQVSLIAVIIITVLILVGLIISPEQLGMKGGFGGVAILITVIGAAAAFIASSSPLGIEMPRWVNDLFRGADWTILLSIAAVIIFIAWMTSEDDPDKGAWKKVQEGFQALPGAFEKGGSS
jgi:hypothetical protein